MNAIKYDWLARVTMASLYYFLALFNYWYNKLDVKKILINGEINHAKKIIVNL